MRMLLAVLALGLNLTACTSAALDGDGGSAAAVEETASATTEPDAPSATPAPTETPAPTATPEPPQSVSNDRCGGSLEGCFRYDEMDEYVAAIVPMVTQYFTTAYEGLPEPEIVYIPNGRHARTYCGVSNSQAYEYCTANQTIYIGQDLIWAFYRQAGDAAPALALAHEWGHHLQSIIGVRYRSQTGAIAFENQADCIAGAWALYADEQGWLETEDDIGDIETLMRLIGSRESSNRDHGTIEERTEAFELSFSGGIGACNAYFPNSPVG